MKTKKKTMLGELIGDKTKFKLMEWLIECKGLEETKHHMIKGAGVSKNKGYQFLNELEKRNILINTRNVAHISLYKLNEKNEIVKKFDKLFLAILKSNI